MGGFKEMLQYFNRLSEEDEWTEEESEAASAKRREIMEKEFLEERLALNLSLTIPFPMGGVKEKLQYFNRLCEENERHHLSSLEPRPHPPLSSSAMCESEEEEEKEEEEKEEEDEEEEVQPFLCEEDKWTEEEREDPSAKRREIRAMQHHLSSLEPRPQLISSALAVPFTMSGCEAVRSIKRWPVAQKRRQRPLDYLHTFSMLPSSLAMSESEEEEEEEEEEEDEEEEVQPFLCEEDEWTEEEREEAALEPEIRKIEQEHLTLNRSSTMSFSMSRVKEIFRSVMRQFVEQKRPESMMSMQRDRPMGLLPPVKRPDPPSREYLLDYEPDPNIPLSPPSHNSSPEEERAGSPAPSCVSMKSDRSMNYPISFKRPASCESVKSDQSMGPPIAFKRYKSSPEEERAVSPASSCESMKSDRSMGLPVSF